MNFVCKRSDLLFGVQLVLNAVSSRNTLPILSNILFESEGQAIFLSSTDLEVSIKCHIPAEVSSSGSITIPAKRLFEIVRELPDKDISFSINDNYVITVACEKTIFKINGLSKEEYPVLPKVKNDKGFNLSKKMLLDMIKKTIFSVSSDETRYVLNGVMVMVDNDLIRLVSTDGHRLALIENKLSNKIILKVNNIIPAKALQELSKILNEEGEVNIQLTDNQMIFSTAQVVLMTRLIDGQFPNYDQVIPKQADKIIKLNIEKLLSATRRVSLMASDKSNSVKYAIGNNKLLITANTPEVGEAQEEIELEYAGEGIAVAYNAKYILDVLKNMGDENCILELTTNLNPGVFKPEKSEAQYLCVVMPMRT